MGRSRQVTTGTILGRYGKLFQSTAGEPFAARLSVLNEVEKGYRHDTVTFPDPAKGCALRARGGSLGEYGGAVGRQRLPTMMVSD